MSGKEDPTDLPNIPSMFGSALPLATPLPVPPSPAPSKPPEVEQEPPPPPQPSAPPVAKEEIAPQPSAPPVAAAEVRPSTPAEPVPPVQPKKTPASAPERSSPIHSVPSAVRAKRSAAEILAEARISASHKAAPPATPPALVDDETTSPGGSIELLVAHAMPSARVISAKTIYNGIAFKAVWKANLARGKADKDLGLITSANVLLSAIDRLGEDMLAAAHVDTGDGDAALFVDLIEGRPIAILTPAQTYLAGS